MDQASNEIRNRLVREKSPDMNAILHLLGKCVSADRICVCLFPLESDHNNSTRELYHWESGSWKSKNSSNKPEDFEWWNDSVFDGEHVLCEDTAKLQPGEGPDVTMVRAAGVRSLAAYPFRSEETGYTGIIELNWVEPDFGGTDPDLNALAMIVEMVSSHIIRSQAEEKLRRSESRFRSLIQKSSDIVAVLGLDRKFMYVSPSVKKVLGYEEDELLQSDAFSFIHEQDLPDVEKAFDQVRQKPESDIIAEYRFQHKKGHWVYLESVGYDMTDDPDLGGIVINSRDISDRKKAQQQLIKARDLAEDINRVKTALLANMSHEMRTPLTGILGFASILESDIEDPEHRKMAGRIQSSGRRLLETIESILDLARLEAEQVDIHPEEVNIIDEVSRAMDMHIRTAEHKGLSFEVKSEFDRLPVHVDRQLFNRVLYNLLSNAFKYTDRGKVSVIVSVADDQYGKWLQVDVKDTGVGIEKEFLPKAFEEFQQESTGFSRKFEGTGLGLTISRRLVEIMGGTITAESEKNKGSTFTIRLPYKDSIQIQRDIAEKVPAEPQEDPARPRILLVEDDFDSSDITSLYLGSKYDVSAVDTGERALEILRQHTFDLVIMDISLGTGMDGVDTLKAMKNNPVLAKIPAIALTAHALSGDEEYYLSQGFTGYLAKPFKKNELMKLVGQYV